jgi:hypothetical protein
MGTVGNAFGRRRSAGIENERPVRYPLYLVWQQANGDPPAGGSTIKKLPDDLPDILIR